MFPTATVPILQEFFPTSKFTAVNRGGDDSYCVSVSYKISPADIVLHKETLDEYRNYSVRVTEKTENLREKINEPEDEIEELNNEDFLTAVWVNESDDESDNDE